MNKMPTYFDNLVTAMSLVAEQPNIKIVGQTAVFDYIAKSGNVVIGSGQKIGTITAGYADDQYSVKYKQSNTVEYKQNNITIKFGE